MDVVIRIETICDLCDVDDFFSRGEYGFNVVDKLRSYVKRRNKAKSEPRVTHGGNMCRRETRGYRGQILTHTDWGGSR